MPQTKTFAGEKTCNKLDIAERKGTYFKTTFVDLLLNLNFANDAICKFDKEGFEADISPYRYKKPDNCFETGEVADYANFVYEQLSEAYPDAAKHESREIIQSGSVHGMRISIAEELPEDFKPSMIGQLLLTNTGNGVHSYHFAMGVDKDIVASQLLTENIAPYVAVSHICNNSDWEETAENLLQTVFSILWASVVPGATRSNIILKSGYDSDRTGMQTIYIKFYRRLENSNGESLNVQIADFSITRVKDDSFVVESAIDIVNSYEAHFGCGSMFIKDNYYLSLKKQLSCLLCSLYGLDSTLTTVKICKLIEGLKSKLAFETVRNSNATTTRAFRECECALDVFDHQFDWSTYDMAKALSGFKYFSTPLKVDVERSRRKALATVIKNAGDFMSNYDYATAATSRR